MTIRDWQPMLRRSLTLAALGTFALGLTILSAPLSASAADTVLQPGDSIQDAVDAASPGDKIIIMPGVYYGADGAEEGVRVKKDFIRLIGQPDGENKVILRPNPDGSNVDGILVEPEDAPEDGLPVIQGSIIQGITVEGFPGNGIKLEYVNNFQILNNESVNNLENGIQPELSANGLVKDNLSYGSLDSALWVEGGTNVRVIGNVLHSSVTGLEVTISNGLVLADNEMYNNTVGMGLYHPSAAGSETVPPVIEDWKAMNNYVHDNNQLYPTSGLPAFLPPGGGIMLLGVSDTNVVGNRIENNDFFGLAVLDFCFAFNGVPDPVNWCVPPYGPNTKGTDPVPRDNRIRGNVFVNNGTDPPNHPLAPFAADIIEAVFDPSAGNRFDGNRCATYSSIPGGVEQVPAPCPSPSYR
ncbi:MAG: right-handed parallel beta-helix repeat-containing protein [Myxococcales bacterium]|jgi:parallel beta-helix repeat protein